MKHCIRPNKYVTVNLTKNNKCVPVSLHRILAIAFIPNAEDYPVVNHIDNNPSNNSLENLEWSTQKHNVQHSVKAGRWCPPTDTKKDHPHSMSVVCYTLTGEFVGSWLGASEAVSAWYATAKSHVNACCNGARKTHNNLIWKREET